MPGLWHFWGNMHHDHCADMLDLCLQKSEQLVKFLLLWLRVIFAYVSGKKLQENLLLLLFDLWSTKEGNEKELIGNVWNDASCLE